MMDIIERYVTEVGRHLPEKSRPDVVNELRSTLEDMLEDRARASGHEPDEDMAVELLKEYGAPHKVAASYLPPKYLIGPQLYPGFITVAKIVLPIVLIVFLVMFGFAVAQPGNTLEAVAELFGNIFGGTVYALGMLMLVFAVIERLSPEAKIPELDWDPRSLRPAEILDERPKVVELATNIFFTIIAIVIFSIYGRQLGMIVPQEGIWRMVPIFTEAFFRFIPLFVTLWILSIGRDLWVIAQNRWSVGARAFSGILQMVNIGVLIALMSGAPIINLGPDAQAELTRIFGSIDFVQVNHWINIAMKVLLALALAGSIVQLVQLAAHLFRQLANTVNSSVRS
jgi:hypothetical protein